MKSRYGRECRVIEYGGDHALNSTPVPMPDLELPQNYALALCRIEPENNVSLILDAFANMPSKPLVFVGNWSSNKYGRALRDQYSATPNLHLINPVYNPQYLQWLRGAATSYIHGHSAGGTNPALVEMMHFGIPIFSHGCVFNRYTTENKAAYFLTASDLRFAIESMSSDERMIISASMLKIAKRRYRWSLIGNEYFRLFEKMLNF